MVKYFGVKTTTAGEAPARLHDAFIWGREQVISWCVLMYASAQNALHFCRLILWLGTSPGSPLKRVLHEIYIRARHNEEGRKIKLPTPHALFFETLRRIL